MRTMQWALLAAAVVLPGCAAAVAGPKERRAPAQKEAVKAPAETRTVSGYGEDDRAARSVALRSAQEWIEQVLREKYQVSQPVPRWQLDPEYLTKADVLSEPEPPAPDPAADKAIRAQYKVTLTSEYVSLVRRHAREEQQSAEKTERQENVSGRQLLTARLLGGALALLLVVAGYLRLEEATRGYYTKLLRLGAFVLLVLAAAGLWMTV